MKSKSTKCNVFYTKYKVYCLVDFFGNVFYVGITRKKLTERLCGHISECNNPLMSSEKKNVILRSGKNISIHELDYVVFTESIFGAKADQYQKALKVESDWINKLSKVHNLTNLNVIKKG